MTAAQLDFDAALAAKEEGQRQVVEASDGWAKICVADTIRKWAEQRRPFSLNDVRSAFPEVRSGLPGAMVSAAHRAGLIVRVGYEPSTLKSTKGHPIAVWCGVDPNASP